MSFWDTSDGGTAADTGTEFEVPSSNLEPIPDGSSLLAMIEEAKWAIKDLAQVLEIRWSIVAPNEYKNRKIFQKLWVTDDDPNAKDADKAAKKRDKARRMLAAIDANAGGQLLKAGQPTDETLALNLVGKPMVIKCMTWSMPDRERPGEVIEGNWIAAVGPASKPQHIAEAKPRAAPSAPAGGSYGGKFRDFKVDDEIPF